MSRPGGDSPRRPGRCIILKVDPLHPPDGTMIRRKALRALALGTGLFPSASRALAIPLTGSSFGGISVAVEDEFSPLKAAIVHDASNAVDLGTDALVCGLTKAEARGQSHPETGPVSAA